jgi:hypothetical protein
VASRAGQEDHQRRTSHHPCTTVNTERAYAKTESLGVVAGPSLVP